MSFRRLVARLRTDATYRVPDAITEARNKPPTFIPKLIRQSVDDPEDLEHLEQVAQYDPIAHYITDQIATLALDDWFEFTDDDGNVIMEDVQKEMLVLGYKKYLTQLLKYERRYGYSYGFKGKNKYITDMPNGARLASLHAFTPIECKVKKYDEVGDPVQMEVTVYTGVSDYSYQEKTILLDAEDFSFLNTRPIGRGYTGISALHPCWDVLTYLRYTLHSMGWYDMKIGNGLFVLMTKAGIPDTLVARAQTSFEDASTKRNIVVDGSKVESLEWKGASSSATDFPAHVDVLLNMIAAATGIPKDVLVGATAGVISGSEVNVKSLYSLLNKIQASVEPMIRQDIRDMGFDYEDYNFSWIARYAHDEDEQANIAMLKAQTLAIRSGWLEINEIREIEGLDPIEDGDQLMSDKDAFKMSVSGLGGPDDEQNNNPEGKQT